jgi:signal transduction histidine kinase
MMEIEDNGKGMVRSDNTFGNGLNNIRHRAMELNGKSAILSSREGKGTIIQVVCPLKSIR